MEAAAGRGRPPDLRPGSVDLKDGATAVDRHLLRRSEEHHV